MAFCNCIFNKNITINQVDGIHSIFYDSQLDYLISNISDKMNIVSVTFFKNEEELFNRFIDKLASVCINTLLFLNNIENDNVLEFISKVNVKNVKVKINDSEFQKKFIKSINKNVFKPKVEFI